MGISASIPSGGAVDFGEQGGTLKNRMAMLESTVQAE